MYVRTLTLVYPYSRSRKHAPTRTASNGDTFSSIEQTFALSVFCLVEHVPYSHRAGMACVSDLLFQNTASATSEYGACFHIIAYSLVTCTRTCSRAHEPTATTACVCVSTCARLASVFSDDDYPRIPRSTAADRAKRSSG